MSRHLTCIECPEGCVLNIDIENGKAVKVEGHKCEKGEIYGIKEVENPVRILSSAVKTEGLSVRMVPVRTDRPIPKSDIFKAMDEIKKYRLKRSVRVGDVLISNILNTGADLIATRDVCQEL